MVGRLQLLVIAGLLVLAAFSTGADFLFFLVYLGLLVGGGAYVVTRLGLSDLEAGYALSQLHGSVGEHLRVTYTLRNTSRLPKPWLEVEQGSNLPYPLPGRAIGLGPRSERTWAMRVPLSRRGHFRVDPLQVRTGDPFGLFESSASVGTGATLIVYPRVEPLPFWHLPPTGVEGDKTSRVRAYQTTPLVTSVRPYAPGDGYNRIHWPTTARHQAIHVKEFDLEQAADVLLFLDLDARVQRGQGDDSTLEAAVRVAAATAAQALGDNRAVGLTALGRRRTVLPPDRGPRQYQKVMQALAAAQADGETPLFELLTHGLVRLRRGMTVLIITSSLETSWVRPLAALRPRGVGVAVCHLDAAAFEAIAHPEHARRGTAQPADGPLPELERAERVVRHALAEYDVPVHAIVPRRPLGELLVTPGAVNMRRTA